jgi:hypothetical protein
MEAEKKHRLAADNAGKIIRILLTPLQYEN